MTKESFEHLSSLMDGELSRETGLFMTRRLSSDDELCAAWRRYHLIRDCLRQPGKGRATPDFGERVRSALENEAADTSAPTLRAWLKPLSGLAIAASVALMAITLVRPGAVDSPVEPGISPVASFTSPNTLPAVPLTQPASYSADQREVDRRLNSYLLRHNQLAGSTGRQGFVSFVPIISAGTQATTDVTEDSPPQEAQAAAEAGADSGK